MSEKHCDTCICGKRAPVMNDHHLPRDQQHGHGTITFLGAAPKTWRPAR